jgi:CLASP N terminal
MKWFGTLPRKSSSNYSSPFNLLPSVDSRNAPGHARADLKKLLQTNHVRKTTSQYILSQLGLLDTTDLSSSVRSDEGFHEEAGLVPPRPETKRVASTVGSVTASVAGSATTSAILHIPGAEMEVLEARVVASKGDLEHMFQGMSAAFEGRESEQNWNLRDQHINTMRGLLRGNAYKEYPAAFTAGVGSLQGGIVKGVRFFVWGPDVDVLVEDTAVSQVV